MKIILRKPSGHSVKHKRVSYRLFITLLLLKTLPDVTVRYESLNDCYNQSRLKSFTHESYIVTVDPLTIFGFKSPE